MIHLLFGLPFGTETVSVSDYDPATGSTIGEQVGSAAGWLYGDAAIARRGGSALVVGGVLGLETVSYQVGDRTWDGAAYTLGVELGGRWTWGRGVILGTADLGLGPHLRVGLPDWSEGLWALTGGAHASIGMELATGTVRPTATLALAGDLSNTYASADVTLPDTTLDWRWSAGGVRALVLFGVAVGSVQE